MNQIISLRDKRSQTWDAAKAFLDSKRGGDGLLSPEDVTVYEKMEADVVAMGREIDRLERQSAIDRELSLPTSIPLTNKPGAPDEGEKRGRATDEYKKAFWNVMRGRIFTPEVQNALKVGQDSEGGFLVPEEFEARLIQALEEVNVMRGLATIVTSSGEKKIPVVAVKGTASWVEEEGAIPESDDAFGQVSLGAYKLATMIKVSNELMNDSAFDMEAYIAQGFAGRIGNREEESFLIGDGSGKPTGILDDTGGGQLGVTTAGSAAITLDEVMDLFYSLKSPYRKNARFIMNDSTVKAIRKLKDSTGQYLWQPSIKEATPDTILSRPLVTSAYMPEIAAGTKPIAFGDFSYFWISDRQGRIFKKLIELYASTDQVGFLATQRVDAKIILPEAVKILKMKA